MRNPRSVACVGIAGGLLLAGLAAPLAAQPALAGSEIALAAPTADPITDVALASLPAGGLVAAWEIGLDVYVRRYDASASPLAAAKKIGVGSGIDVAPAGAGFIVVGLDDRDLYPLRLARIFDANSRPVGSPFVVETPTTSPDAGAPRAVAEPGGGFAVAWSSNAGIYLRRFTAGGVARGGPIRIGGANAAASYLDLAENQAGKILVVWLQAGSWLVFGQLLGTDGAPLGPPFQVSLGTSYRPPVAAFTAGGRFVVAWHGHTGDPLTSPDGVLARLYTRGGLPLGEPMALVLEEPGHSLSAPVLAADGMGHAAIAWTGGASGMELREIATNGTIGPAHANQPSPPIAGTPLALAGWGDGNYLFVWERHQHGTWQSLGLAGQRFATRAAAGTLRLELGSVATAEGDGPLALRVERREGNRGAVSVDYDLRAETALPGVDFLPISGTLTFADGESNPREVVLPVLDDALADGDVTLVVELADPSGGALLGAPAEVRVEIRDDDVPSPLLANAGPVVVVGQPEAFDTTVQNPRVAALAGGGLAALWQSPGSPRQPPQAPLLRSVLLDPAGAEIARDFGPAERASYPCLTAQPGGELTVAGLFSSGSGPTSSVLAQRYDAAGSPQGTAIPLPAPPAAIAARAGGIYVLSANRLTSGQSLALAAYDSQGHRLGSISAPAAGAVCAWTAPALAADGAGRAVVVWSGPGTSCDRLRLRRIDATGQPVGGALQVDAVAGRRAGNAAVGMAPDGRFVVAWEAEGDGDGLGIYARIFDATGAALGAALQVNSHRAGDQTEPRIAVQGDGRFVVLWRSPDGAGAPRLFGQLFAANGGRLGDDFPLEPASTEAIEGEADLAVDAIGRYAAVWRRFLGSGQDAIVVRRLR